MRPEHLAAAGLDKPIDMTGKPISLTKILGGKLEQVGAGQYRVMVKDRGGEWVALGTGAAPAAGSARAAQGGNLAGPFILDLTKLEPVLRKERPEFFSREWSRE